MSDNSEYTHSLERIAEDKVGARRPPVLEFDAPSPPRPRGPTAERDQRPRGEPDAAPGRAASRAPAAVVAGELVLAPEDLPARPPVAVGGEVIDGALERSLAGLDVARRPSATSTSDPTRGDDG